MCLRETSLKDNLVQFETLKSFNYTKNCRQLNEKNPEISSETCGRNITEGPQNECGDCFQGEIFFALINIQHASLGFVCVEEDAHTSELKGYYNLIYMHMWGPLYCKRVCERLPASVRVLSVCVFTCLLACLCGRATACYNPSLNMYDEEEVQATIAVSPKEL